MRHNKKNNFPAQYVLLFMSIFCVIIIVCSVRLSSFSQPVNAGVNYVIVPMQKGVNRVGNGLTNLRERLTSRQKLQEENEQLTEQLAAAREELYQVQIDQDELKQLQALYEMDESYADYDKVAAEVIGRNSSNWFSTFLINKGSRDGVTVDMNVLADGGLVGIVTDVGPHYATVRAIIDDNSNISCKNLSTSELIVVNGSLQSMNQSSTIQFSDLRDADNLAEVGDEITTSTISDLYLPNIPVGYITEIAADSNELTKSGRIAPIVDFSHLEKVFVVLQTKADLIYGEEE